MATRYMWTGSGVTARANSTAYTAGARVVIALTDTSTNYLVVRRYVLECTTGGTSGAAVPAWSASYTPDTSTITDGTVTWTVRNPGYSSGTTENWTFATIYFQYALSAANADGDVVYVHYTSQENRGQSTNFTVAANVNVLSVNKDSGNSPTAMETNGWIGDNTTGYTFGILGQKNAYFYGITLKNGATNSGASNEIISLAIDDGANYVFENCYFWSENATTTGGIRIGSNTSSFGTYASTNVYVQVINSTFRFGNASQTLIIGGGARIDVEKCSVSSAGTIPSTLISLTASSNPQVNFVGCDLSQITGTLVGSSSIAARIFQFAQCKLGANVTILATQSPANKSSGAAYVFDCSSGDTHTFFGYYDAFGSCVSDTGIYYTTGAAAQSWKITTTANCSFYTPFTSPFVDFYNTGTSSITPYFEILRDGSTTAFQNDEVWGEFFVKTTSGSTQSTPYNDRMALLGTPANQASGAGTGSWTGEAASAWSGKIDSGSAVTPAENGHIRGRVVVGEPSITVYVNPEVKT